MGNNGDNLYLTEVFSSCFLTTSVTILCIPALCLSKDTVFCSNMFILSSVSLRGFVASCSEEDTGDTKGGGCSSDLVPLTSDTATHLG